MMRKPNYNLERIYTMQSFSEFLNAFFWASVLRSCVLPLDRSFDSLYLFFLDNNFFEQLCNADGLGRGSLNQGSFCAIFADYVLRMNNSRYAKKLPFATTAELHNIYIQFCRGDQRFKNPFHMAGRQNSAQSTSGKNQTSTGSKKFTCNFFNLKDKTCFRTKLKDGNCRDKSGAIYKHLCDHQTATGEICGRAHPKFEHSGN